MTVKLTESQYKVLVDAFHKGEWKLVKTDNPYTGLVEEKYDYRGLEIIKQSVYYPELNTVFLIDGEKQIKLPEGKFLYDDTFGREVKRKHQIEEQNLKGKLASILGE